MSKSLGSIDSKTLHNLYKAFALSLNSLDLDLSDLIARS